ncbi:MAG: hypothetical protein KTR32_20930 [Granulosicoccus sp.]|nr:hypothetical protein [Granulosicoccus sp.]
MTRWILTLLILASPVSGVWSATTVDVLVVLGLPDKLLEETGYLARQSWSKKYSVVVTTVSELDASANTPLTAAKVVLTAGVEGCRYAVERVSRTPVLCTLLSRESYNRIREQYPDARSSALVLDQPLKRQVKVSSALFPALQTFSVLRSSDSLEGRLPDSTKEFSFDSRLGHALAPAVTEAVENTDALVAQADRGVFNRNTIRTIMLTAYGHGKPIIGYSEAYVRAGALMATYSTIRQCFKQATEILGEFLLGGEDVFTTVHSPRYFSIAVNSNIANSLKLIQNPGIPLERSWQDEDFFK